MEHTGLFADSPVNRGRQVELDLVKGLAILFMLLVHCFESFTSLPWEPTWPNRLIFFLGGPPAAPVFMFALGVGLAYTRKNTPGDLARRGLRILLLGFAVAFFRDFLSMYVLYLRTGDPADLAVGIEEALGVDILPFAGLAFLFFAAASKLKFQSVHYAAAALLGAAANLLLAGRVLSSPALNVIAGLIWGTSEYSWFPFLTWIPYPIVGYLFGQLLVRCRDKARLYRLCLEISLPAAFAGWLLFRHYGIPIGWENYDYYSYVYFHHNLLGNLLFITFVVAWISLFFFLAPPAAGVCRCNPLPLEQEHHGDVRDPLDDRGLVHDLPAAAPFACLDSHLFPHPHPGNRLGSSDLQGPQGQALSPGAGGPSRGLKFEALPGLQHHHAAEILGFHSFFEFQRVLFDRGEGIEVHGDDHLRADHLHCLHRIGRTHGVIIADGQEGHIQPFILEELHFREQTGVPGMVDLPAVHFHHKTAGQPSRDSAAVLGRDQLDAAEGCGQLPANITREDLQPLRLKKLPGHFHRGADHRPSPLGDLHRIPHMVVVAVADQNEICLHFPCLFAGEGVSSQEGVDQDFRLGIFQQETGMTQKLNPHEHLPFLMDSQKQPASACSLIRLILRQTALGTFFLPVWPG